MGGVAELAIIAQDVKEKPFENNPSP